jgi:glucosylceramidase
MVVQTTHDLSQRLTRLPDRRFLSGVPRGMPVITVEDSRHYQRIGTVGAAMTDSSAWLIQRQLSQRTRTDLLRRLFTHSGIDLRFVRLPMAASDFTATGRPYSYDDVGPGAADPDLARFSIGHDDAYIVPLLRSIRLIQRQTQIIAMPWSPPGWMKTNDSLDNRNGSGTLRAAAYAPLAQYFIKFIRAYASRGIHVDAVTPQNEPGHPTPYPGLNLSAAEEARFITQDLVRALRAAGLTTMIYGLDANWSRLTAAQQLVTDPAVADNLAGVAWHCYSGNPRAMTELHDLVPRLPQIVTECSTGISPGPPAELLIASLRNWASSVLLWNIALDPRGGPVQPPNSGCRGCTGIVTVDERTHTVSYNSDYYQLGQLTRFVQSGAYRIGSPTFVSYNSTALNRGPSYATGSLDDVAIANPNGTTTLLAYNNAPGPVRFAVAWHGRAFTYTLPAAATVTFVWR